MNKNVVTSGQKFTDIDALACAVAYSELLISEGKESEVVLPGILNASITQTIKNWGIRYETSPSFSDADYIVVDVSDPEHIAVCAKKNTVVEIFDHHLGFEKQWEEKLGEKSHIEFIGACATLIWEEYKKRYQEKSISTLSSNLLSVAILSNTLNFGAQITNQRDTQAFQELQSLNSLSKEWIEQYFSDQEKDIDKDVAKAIMNDTKVITTLTAFPSLIIGQLELWDGSSFLEKNQNTIKQVLQSFKSDCWFMSIPSIKEKKNHIYTENKQVKDILSKTLDIIFEENIGITKKLWLRKEILKELHSL